MPGPLYGLLAVCICNKPCTGCGVRALRRMLAGLAYPRDASPGGRFNPHEKRCGVSVVVRVRFAARRNVSSEETSHGRCTRPAYAYAVMP